MEYGHVKEEEEELGEEEEEEEEKELQSLLLPFTSLNDFRIPAVSPMQLTSRQRLF